MGIGALRDLEGEWELAVDLPGAEDVRGHVVFEALGDVLVQRTAVPVPDAPDSCSVIVSTGDGGYVQHYFDSRGVARLYAMTFDGRVRFIGTVGEDGTTIDAEWQKSADGREWQRDFGLTYLRIGLAS
jgi:hypothetical protein